MKQKLKQRWYIPFALLAVFALVAASPTPRKLLSETFTNWIKIEGSSPMIYQETTSSSGGASALNYYVGYDDTTDFSAGAKFEDGVGINYSIRAGGYNGPLGIYVDTDGDVGIGTVPMANAELHVDGDTRVSGEVFIGGDLEVGGEVFIGNAEDLIVDNGKLETDVIEARDSDGLEIKTSDGTTTIYLDDRGCVGINNMNPSCEYGWDLEVGTDGSPGNVRINGGTLRAGTLQSGGGIFVGGFAYIESSAQIAGDLMLDWNAGEYPEVQPRVSGSIFVQGNDSFSARGDAQSERYTMSREAELNGTGWYDLYTVRATTVTASVPTDTAWLFEASIVVLEDGAGTSAAYTIVGLIVNDGGTTTLEASTVTTIYEDDSTWEARAAASGVYLKIQIRDTDGPGSGGDGVRAVATMEITEVSHP